MLVIFLAEYAIIRYKLEVLEEVEEKKDFTRSAQLEAQQISLMVQQHLSGQQNLSSEIASRIEEVDHRLKIVGDGGRIDGTGIFLKPLKRLSRISFDQLLESWRKYKENILQ
jgi:hypothetical protein